MANKEKEAAKDTSRAAIVADSASLEAEKKQAVIDAGANQVYIASSLQNGMTFTDLETAESGRVTIPGVNNHLQGALEANLLADGGASVLVKLPADQWAKLKLSMALCLFSPTTHHSYASSQARTTTIALLCNLSLRKCVLVLNL